MICMPHVYYGETFVLKKKTMASFVKTLNFYTLLKFRH